MHQKGLFAMAEKPRILEVTVISAEDLRINGKPVKKKSSYVIVKAVDSHSQNHQQAATTKADTAGENCSLWNEKLCMDLPSHVSSLLVEVNREGGSGDNALIAAARIPASDFMGSYAPENYLHFLSYRLRDRHGERNGIINISVRVVNSVPAYSGPPSAALYHAPEVGFPIGRRDCSGIVTGIPVSSTINNPFRY